MEWSKLTRLLDELINLDDPLSSDKDNEKKLEYMLDKFKSFYEGEYRHSYHEVTEFILDRWKLGGEAEDDCLVLARKIKEIIDLADSKCQKQCPRLHCEMIEPPSFSCESDGGCSEYKKTAKSLNKLYDHILLEMMRYREIQKDNKKIINNARRLESRTRDLLMEFRKQAEISKHSSEVFEEEKKALQKKQEEIEEKIESINTEYADIKKKELDLRGKQTELDKTLDETKNMASNIREETKQIYIQVVTILGIFTGIVFALFGSVEGLSVIASAFISDTITISEMVLLTCIIGFFIFNLLFVLVGIIFKMIHKDSNFSKLAATIMVVVNILCVIGIVWGIGVSFNKEPKPTKNTLNTNITTSNHIQIDGGIEQ